MNLTITCALSVRQLTHNHKFYVPKTFAPNEQREKVSAEIKVVHCVKQV